MIRFTIPYPPAKKDKAAFCKRFGLNAYYAGKHWTQRKDDARDLHMLTEFSMKRAHIRKQLVNYPVSVRFLWDDGLDLDNHAVLGKAIVDALKGYILPDDNRRWVKKVSHEFWDGGEIAVEVSKYD